MNPRVKKVKVKSDHMLEIQFTDNCRKLFNVKPYMNTGIFKELQNTDYFKKVFVLGNSVAWPNGQDFCPDTLYLESIPIKKYTK